MKMDLSQTIQQRMTMTQQLRQTIELLQMSSAELTDFLSDKLIENPFVDIYIPNRMRLAHRTIGSKSGYVNPLDFVSFENAASLEGVLLEQLIFLRLDKRLHTICAFVIGCLDANGYLSVSVALIAGQLKVSMEDVSDAIRIIQAMEPYGVAASNLEECLMIQLDHSQDMDDGITRILVENDLKSIAQGKINSLALKYKKKPCAIQQAVDLISRLNPKPGSAFSTEPPQYIIPDIVLRMELGEVRLLMNGCVTPQIRINHLYEDMLKGLENKDTVQYLRGQLKEVKWFSQCLEQRNATLLKVAYVIFEQQADFCKYGFAFIKPITLKHVATVLQIHESTVSRAVNGKYTETPWGIYELKRFFSSSIKQSDGEHASAVKVKDRIKALIRHENKSSPLSDQKIADVLRSEGFIISRRTVTKYRDQMKINATSLRIRFDGS
jgi:RNA polymerase sigma-54 factor